jgi:replicative DNA helicase
VKNVKTKIPPSSAESEEAVLGSILIDPDVVSDIMELLTSQDFYLRKHQLIFATMERLFDEGNPVDIVSVTERLRTSGSLEEIGGEVELAKLADLVPTSANFSYYAKTVKEKSLLRSLITAASSIVESAYENGDTDEILDNAEKAIFQITESQVSKTYQPIGKIMHEVFQNLEKLKENALSGRITGVATGYRKLDETTTGFRPSDLVIVAARPSMGKTAFALSIACKMALEFRIPVGIFCLEMSKEQLAQRLLCNVSNFELSKLRAGDINNEEWKRLTTGASILQTAPIIIDDEPSLDPRTLRAKARRIKMEHNIQVLFVDYLQLMHTKGKTDNRQQEISEISRSMKLLARELKITVVALSQLSRAVEQREDKTPRLSDLRESGAIEQDADTVMFLYREEYYKDKSEVSDMPQVTKIIIGKQRNGPVGTLEMVFNPKTVTFYEKAFEVER